MDLIKQESFIQYNNIQICFIHSLYALDLPLVLVYNMYVTLYDTISNRCAFTESVLDLLSVKRFSDRASESFQREQRTYVFFRDILEEVEGIFIQMP